MTAEQTREKLLEMGKTRRFKAVEVPGVGTMSALAMTVGERERFETELADRRAKNQPTSVRALVLARTAGDEKGNRIFTDADADALADMPGDTMERLFQVSIKLNQILPIEGLDDAGDGVTPPQN